MTALGFEDAEVTVVVRSDETSFEDPLDRVERAPRADAPVFRHVQLEPYPCATLERSREEPESLRLRFETAGSLHAVYARSHAQRRDWDRVALDARTNRVAAEYRRAGATLELDLRRLGASGVVDLDIEVIA